VAGNRLIAIDLRIPSKVILTFLAVRLNPSSTPDFPIEISAITHVYRRNRPAHPGNYSPARTSSANACRISSDDHSRLETKNILSVRLLNKICTRTPKTTLRTSAFARKGEPKPHGYLGAASAAIPRSSRRISELSPAIETRQLPSRSGVVDATDDIKGLTPHAFCAKRDCVGSDNPVAFYVPLLEYPRCSLVPDRT
jgi:hypothetical protein